LSGCSRLSGARDRRRGFSGRVWRAAAGRDR
jgi:hypothetical protein